VICVFWENCLFKWLLTISCSWQVFLTLLLTLSLFFSITQPVIFALGLESLGSLKIGNPATDVQRHSTNETFSRHLVVEKVPRNFVFHPSIAGGQLSETSSISSRSLKRLSQLYGIPEWALNKVRWNCLISHNHLHKPYHFYFKLSTH